MKRVSCLVVVPLLVACGQDMTDQPKYEPLETAPGWPNSQSALEPVPGTVARGDRLEPVPEALPLALNRTLLERGKERYEIYCTPCHGLTGQGDGMIVQRGFPAPPSLHQDYLRNVPLRHFYRVITEGSGVMYSYAARLEPDDRWAVAAYIRALQLSQNAGPEDLTDELRSKLEGRP